MKLTHHALTFAGSLVAILAIFHSGFVQAGPAEDYATGTKLYVSGDLFAAMPLLRRAADAGHSAAQASIGEILEQADSVEEAIEYFRKSAGQGNADGQFDLGALLAAGRGHPKDNAAARTWIVLAAEQGHKLAINELALAYINGGLDLTEDERQGAEALRWIRTAANSGYLTAMGKLATAYRSGELGLGIDLKAAEQWADKIRKASGIQKGRRNRRSNDQ